MCCQGYAETATRQLAGSFNSWLVLGAVPQGAEGDTFNEQNCARADGTQAGDMDHKPRQLPLSPSVERSAKRWFVPLGTRLAVPVLILVGSVAVAAYYGLARTSRVTAMRSKEVAADMVAQLTALSIMPAVVFTDEEEMRRGVAAVGKNREITDVEVWSTADEPTLLSDLHRAGGRALGRPKKSIRARTLEPQSAVAVEPIVNPDGKTIATISLRMSTEREAQALSALTRQLWLASLGSALGLAFALVLVLQRLVVAPIRRLQRAAVRLKSGDAALPEELKRAGRFEDEVAQLADTFVGMAGAVRDREERLALRNRELKVILDSVEQGFFTALASGELLPERSAITHAWLGALPEPAHVWDVAERLDPAQAEWMMMAWQQMLTDVLPLDVAIEQLPSRLVRDHRYFDLMYHPVTRNDVLDRVVIVITEVTALVERELALAEQHEFSVLVDQLVRDRRAFFDFWGEANKLVNRIVEQMSDEPSAALRRDIHTLKGNSRFAGLARLATLCHRLEDAMAERGRAVLNQAERNELREAWESMRRRMEPIIHGATSFIQISEQEYDRLLRSLDSKVGVEGLRDQLVALRYEPTRWRLERASEMLLSACEKLHKPRPIVEINDNDLRLPPERWLPFWTVFTHLVTNAADHGVESADARFALGKPGPTTVKFSTCVKRGELIVELSDDGCGIDWGKVGQLARQRGLPADSPEDLTRALLSDGFSLKDTLTETSGRGVGMAAFNAVVQSMGGKIELESTPHRGTHWRVRFPGAGALDVDQRSDRAPARVDGRWPNKAAV